MGIVGSLVEKSSSRIFPMRQFLLQLRGGYSNRLLSIAQPTSFLIKAVGYGLVCPALIIASRFCLAVPAVILDDCRVWQAMLRSDELTRGKWLILTSLLAKSLIGGYVAGMSPFWLASFVRVTVPLPSWFPWILTGASIIGVSIVEPTMFIGFALLYLKMSAMPCASSSEDAGHFANSITPAAQ